MVSVKHTYKKNASRMPTAITDDDSKCNDLTRDKLLLLTGLELQCTDVG